MRHQIDLRCLVYVWELLSLSKIACFSEYYGPGFYPRLVFSCKFNDRLLCERIFVEGKYIHLETDILV